MYFGQFGNVDLYFLYFSHFVVWAWIFKILLSATKSHETLLEMMKFVIVCEKTYFGTRTTYFISFLEFASFHVFGWTLALYVVSVFVRHFVVREAEVILPTFSRDKSILLWNCPLDS